jgi:hypothetical protein
VKRAIAILVMLAGAAFGQWDATPVLSVMRATVAATPVPLTLTNTCLLWLDGADQSTITFNGAKVSAWSDKSGRGNNATQTSAAAQPVAWSTQGVQFAGAQHMLSPGDHTQPFSVISVSWLTNAAASVPFVCDGTDSTHRAVLRHNNGGVQCDYFAGAVVATNLSPDHSRSHIFAAIFNGSSSYLVYDGNWHGPGNPGTQNGPGWTIGARFSVDQSWWQGWIKDFIVYEGVVSSNDMNTLRSYLQAKWGTP